jgi:hypothetical protein
MADPFRDRRFSGHEVRRILRRAADIAERTAGARLEERSGGWTGPDAQPAVRVSPSADVRVASEADEEQAEARGAAPAGRRSGR